MSGCEYMAWEGYKIHGEHCATVAGLEFQKASQLGHWCLEQEFTVIAPVMHNRDLVSTGKVAYQIALNCPYLTYQCWGVVELLVLNLDGPPKVSLPCRRRIFHARLECQAFQCWYTGRQIAM